MVSNRSRAKIARKLRALREAKKWTRTQLAATVGCSGIFIEGMEAARRPIPSALAHRLAIALGVDLAELTQQ